VDGYDENFILSSDLEKMADLLVEKYTLKPVQLHHDRTEIVEHGRHLHRPILLRALALVLIENLFPQAQILWRGFEWSRFSWKDHVLHR
jgi:hypothetical protein